MTRIERRRVLKSNHDNAKKYIYRLKISEAKFRKIVRLFSVDLAAVQIARLSHLNRNTVNRLIKAIRERIALSCEKEAPVALEPDLKVLF